MEFGEYQKKSRVTALYNNAGSNFVYPALGLAGETGEVVEKIKKLMRDGSMMTPEQVTEEKKTELAKEMGDVVWYLAQLATELGLSFDDIATQNLEKLMSRLERDVIGGDGDNR